MYRRWSGKVAYLREGGWCREAGEGRQGVHSLWRRKTGGLRWRKQAGEESLGGIWQASGPRPAFGQLLTALVHPLAAGKVILEAEILAKEKTLSLPVVGV